MKTNPLKEDALTGNSASIGSGEKVLQLASAGA
jgi:hypothetical protein